MLRARTSWVAAPLVGVVAVAVPLLAGSVVAGAAARAHRITASSAQSEAAALKEAHWMSNVSTSVGKGSWTFRSTGVPPTSFVAADYAVPSNPASVSAVGAKILQTSSLLKDQNYDYTLPLTPVYSKKTTPANLGPIGIALDGAVFYNPYEENDTTVATADNFIATSGGTNASFLDDCDGHPGPNGEYHYHGLPTCLVSYATGESLAPVAAVTSTAGTTTAAVTLANAASRKPVLLGFAFDGYGIYDNIAMNGSTVPVSSLDACNGIFSAVPGYPKGVYHYVLENIKGARADIACYHGVVSSAYTSALQSSLGAGGNGGGQGQGGGGSGGGSGSGSPPQGGPPPGGPPPGGGPPNGGAPGANSVEQTAYTLAANQNEDTLLRAVLAVSNANDCGS